VNLGQPKEQFMSADDVDEMWDFLIERGIASEETLGIQVRMMTLRLFRR